MIEKAKKCKQTNNKERKKNYKFVQSQLALSAIKKKLVKELKILKKKAIFFQTIREVMLINMRNHIDCQQNER